MIDRTACETELELWVRDDRLAVLLNCTADLDGLEPLLTRIEKELASLGVAPSLNRGELEAQLREAAKEGPQVTEMKVKKIELHHIKWMAGETTGLPAARRAHEREEGA